MHKMFTKALTLAASLLLLSCSDTEDAFYPNIITEMADLKTDDSGCLTQLIVDNGTCYTVSNRQGGFAKKVTYRVLCGYVPDHTTATLYQLNAAYYLRDSSAVAQRDPVTIRSIWRTPRYINLHLAPKTQGGVHYWGFVTDSIVSVTLPDDTEQTHAYLSLHHSQNGDPASYTEETYASIPLDSIKGMQPNSPITLHIQTFEGTKTIQVNP